MDKIQMDLQHGRKPLTNFLGIFFSGLSSYQRSHLDFVLLNYFCGLCPTELYLVGICKSPLQITQQDKTQMDLQLGNQPIKKIPNNYKKYLENSFRSSLGLLSIQLRLIFRKADNPYDNKTNKLTERQIKKRQRLIKHNKKVKK